MHVCILTTGFPRFRGDLFGAFVLEMARALVAQGTQVTVVAPHEKGIARHEKIEGISGGTQNMAAQNALLLTVLNVTDELFQARAEHHSLKESIRAQSRNLLSRMSQDS